MDASDRCSSWGTPTSSPWIPAKWKFPPFGATRDGGYVYGRGAVDDKDNLTAALMTMLLLKRNNVPLDRDVIFVAEAGEEGSTGIGIDFIVRDHLPHVEAEYCLAEGGGVTRKDGRVAVRNGADAREDSAPHRARRRRRRRPRIRSAEDQSDAFISPAPWRASANGARRSVSTKRRQPTSSVSPRSRRRTIAKHYRDVLSSDPAVQKAADDWLFEHEPRHSSMLRTSASPNIVTGGYRFNVIPSQATATVDVRLLPDENPDAFLEMVKKIVNDPSVEVRYPAAAARGAGVEGRLDSEAFRAIEASIKRVYDTVTVPTMSTGATDMAKLRGKGIQCFGIGPAIDIEDGAKGFGAHSDQERLLETELHRFVRFNWDIVTSLARAAR